MIERPNAVINILTEHCLALMDRVKEVRAERDQALAISHDLERKLAEADKRNGQWYDAMQQEGEQITPVLEENVHLKNRNRNLEKANAALQAFIRGSQEEKLKNELAEAKERNAFLEKQLNNHEEFFKNVILCRCATPEAEEHIRRGLWHIVEIREVRPHE